MTKTTSFEETQELWRDAAKRRSRIIEIQLYNATVKGIFMRQRSEGFSESVAVEMALIATAEESEFFQEMAVETIGRRGV